MIRHCRMPALRFSRLCRRDRRFRVTDSRLFPLAAGRRPGATPLVADFRRFLLLRPAVDLGRVEHLHPGDFPPPCLRATPEKTATVALVAGGSTVLAHPEEHGVTVTVHVG